MNRLRRDGLCKLVSQHTLLCDYEEQEKHSYFVDQFTQSDLNNPNTASIYIGHDFS